MENSDKETKENGVEPQTTSSTDAGIWQTTHLDNMIQKTPGELEQQAAATDNTPAQVDIAIIAARRSDSF